MNILSRPRRLVDSSRCCDLSVDTASNIFDQRGGRTRGGVGVVVGDEEGRDCPSRKRLLPYRDGYSSLSGLVASVSADVEYDSIIEVHTGCLVGRLRTPGEYILRVGFGVPWDSSHLGVGDMNSVFTFGLDVGCRLGPFVVCKVGLVV